MPGSSGSELVPNLTTKPEAAPRLLHASFGQLCHKEASLRLIHGLQQFPLSRWQVIQRPATPTVQGDGARQDDTHANHQMNP